jgi:hypothetical protein
LTRLPGASQASSVAAPSVSGRPVEKSCLPSLPPELVDPPQYEVLRELGRGGRGVVYLARHRLSGRQEVLKVMNREYLSRPESKERFLRELRAASRLNHPNVVEMYTALEAGELLILVMEYVEGHDLARVVKATGPLPVVNACFYVQQAALGLQHAFEKGMVHRDIKPQNLILTRNGKRQVVKILDFGLAKDIGEGLARTGLTAEGWTLGTPDYMAPEQILDAAHANIRADIYSLGCTLYHLLTGSPPFAGKSVYEVMHAHQSVEARPVNEVRPEIYGEVAAVVDRMMAKDPRQRYQQPAEVAQMLSSLLKAKGRGAAMGELAARADDSAAAQTCGGSDTRGMPGAPNDGPPRRAAKTMDASPFAGLGDALMTPTGTTESMKNRAGAVPPETRQVDRRWMLPVIAVCVSALLITAAALGLWAAGVFKLKTADGLLVLENLPDDAEVTVDGNKAEVSWSGAAKTAEVRIQPGKRRVVVRWRGSQLIGEEVAIEEGGRKLLSARVEQLADAAARPRAPDMAGPPGPDSTRQDGGARPADPGTPGGMPPSNKPGRAATGRDQGQVRAPDGKSAKPERVKPAPDKDGFVRLFDGKSLKGWEKPVENEGTWEVDEQGHLVGKGRVGIGPGILATVKKDFASFHLRITLLKWEGPPAHLLVRSMVKGGKFDGFRVRLNGGAQGNGEASFAGSIAKHVRYRIGDYIKFDVPARGVQVDPGRPLTVEVLVHGNTLTTLVNGTVAAKYEDVQASHQSGQIILACRSDAEIHFKTIEVKELPDPGTKSGSEAGEVLGAGGAIRDKLRKGTKWVGSKTFQQPGGGTFTFVLIVEERKGDTLKGRTIQNVWNVQEIQGTIRNGEISWGVGKPLVPGFGPAPAFKGKLKDDQLELTFKAATLWGVARLTLQE